MGRRLASFCLCLLLAACSDDSDHAQLPLGDDAGPRASDCDVPSEPEALLAYLRAGGYKSFGRESRRHPSTGPHGGEVLTYINPTLEDSLAAARSEHPVCAAAVKELFLGGDQVGGWAVFVKVREDSADGAGFYWFETMSTDADAVPDYDGDGLSLCAGCHSAGADFVLIPFPLQ